MPKKRNPFDNRVNPLPMTKKKNSIDDRLNPMPRPGMAIKKAVANQALKKKAAAKSAVRKKGYR